MKVDLNSFEITDMSIMCQEILELVYKDNKCHKTVQLILETAALSHAGMIASIQPSFTEAKRYMYEATSNINRALVGVLDEVIKDYDKEAD